MHVLVTLIVLIPVLIVAALLLRETSTLAVMIVRMFIPLTGADLLLLDKHFPYFNSLSAKDQRKFA